MHIKNIETECGKAIIEVVLPTARAEEDVRSWSIYLWDENGFPAFHTQRMMEEEDPCIIQIYHPKLWEGERAPRMYCLEIYAVNLDSQMRLIERQFLALYSLKEIAHKGWFLNGHEFEIKGVYYDCVDNIFDAVWQWDEGGLDSRLNCLVKMGANMIIVGTMDGLTEQKHRRLQECCEKRGILLRNCPKNDSYVMGEGLFDKTGIPSKDYYRYKASWSKEPFVYIHDESLTGQSDGGYSVTVYSNCKKVVLLVNGTVFAFQQDGPEFRFQDISIKGFPVCLTVEADECSMSAVCYRPKREGNIY